MATGRLGAAHLSSADYSKVYVCPANTVATVNVSIVNRSAGAVGVRLAVEATETASPVIHSFIEYGTSIVANGVLERTAIVLGAGNTVLAWNDGTSAASCVVWGFEESA